MTHKLGSQLLRLPQIFDGHYFNVPDYQRGYAWGVDQVRDLLVDIEHLMLTLGNGQHFTGTLVINKAPNSERFDIVDGQQRLTTVVILMRCLHAAINDAETAKTITTRYLRRGSLGSERLVFQVGTDSKEFFERVVLGSDSEKQVPRTMAAHTNLHAAKELIEDWLKGKSAKFAKNVLDIVEHRLGLLVYSPVESSEIGIMFEVINNRGKDLSELEKVKNYLIYVATKLGADSTRDKINSRWSSILRNLHTANYTSAVDEKSFLRAVSVLQFSFNKTDSGNVYDMLRKKFLKIDVVLATSESRLKAIKQIESFVDLLENSSHWYAVLYGERRSDLTLDVANVLERIYAQEQHANIMPTFLAVMISHGGKSGPENILLRLLELIEKVNFRVYVARGTILRTDSGQGQLYEIAADYFNKQRAIDLRSDLSASIETQDIQPDDISDVSANLDTQLECALVKFALTFATDEKLIESLQLPDDDMQFDYYNWTGLKYFLICYEASLKKSKTVKLREILKSRNSMKPGDYYSIEHIWATKHEEDIYNRPKDAHVRRRLGNFMLLELNLNIAGSNHGIGTKIDLYMGKRRYVSGDVEILPQPSEMAQAREMIFDAKNVLKRFPPSQFTDGRYKPYYDVHKELCDKREEHFKKFTASQWSLNGYHGYKEALAAIGKDDE
jgi:hypothetical protein